MLINKCEFSNDDYSLNIINPPVLTDEELEYEEDVDDSGAGEQCSLFV